MIKQNTESIDVLKENSEFLFKKIQDMKAYVTTMKTATADHENRISEDKVNEAECYQRRWNLRLYGLQE